jgi:hypothetical protein
VVRGTAGLLVAAALTAGLFVAGIAGADFDRGTVGGLTYVSDGAHLDPAPSTASTSAACPAGDHVVGGGGATFFGGSTSNLASLFPFDGGDGNSTVDDGWTARGSNNIDDEKELSVTAICHRREPVYRKRAVSLEPGRAVTARAECGDARHVSGGGVRVSGPISDAHINATAPFDGPDGNTTADDGWRGTVHNESGGGKTVTVFAICTEFDLVYRSRVFSAPPGGATSRFARCPDSGHLTGGGVKATGSTVGGQVEEDWPVDGGDLDEIPDDVWLVAYGNNAGPERTATVYAICK